MGFPHLTMASFTRQRKAATESQQVGEWEKAGSLFTAQSVLTALCLPPASSRSSSSSNGWMA